MLNVLIEMGKLRDKQAKRVANAVTSNAPKEAIAREQELLDVINVALMMHARIENATKQAETYVSRVGAAMTEIHERILNELHFDLAVPRDRLRIRFHNGYVILSGEVEWPYQKTCAEADVRRVPGVTGVVNDITVRGSAIPIHA